MKISLKSEDLEIFKRQIQVDVNFFIENDIIDYSLLIGYSYIQGKILTILIYYF